MPTKDELSAAGLRPGELARLCGVHPTTVSKWFAGLRKTPEYAVTIVRMWTMLPEERRRQGLSRSA